MARSASGDSIVDRVVRLLEAFGPERPVLTVSELAARAGLPLSTASRLVEQLTEHGLLSRDPDRRVRVGLRMWELAARASPALDLREAAMPFLEDLHAVVRQHAQLGVLDGPDVLFVERLSAPGAVINVTKIAGRLPLHASSAGLVLLAHAGPDVQEEILHRPLRAFTARTITEPQRLRRVLAQIRQEDFVHCRGHIHPDAAALAVPVRSASGQVVAALSVVVPDDERALSRVPVLRAMARGIRQALSAGPLNGSGVVDPGPPSA
ncbi:IclR family transcriptional regulator [Kineosporia sp. NBRC 101677]|uniref:IclR family transcriptional regulator n=1 Tax=Kineosporia sp. NBRC 101677 TaxID=3032197 RepID=UPI0024A00447|nr:IclR family transcriptional regulator [Kineosporia sp. NBRC 101677]GLY18901.1 IclR family transcriptional regulator [Kineosporia sp. NBRC 101677]